MRRRGFWMLGFALTVLVSTASFAPAQAPSPAIPKLIDINTLPKIEIPTPAEPPKLEEGPKTNERKVEVEISPNTGMPRLGEPQEQKIFTIAELALQSSDYIDIRYVENSAHPNDPGIYEKVRTHYGDQIHRLIQDYKNFYLTENMLYVGLAVAVAAPFANTHADHGIRNWYQSQAGNGQSRGADDTAKVFKQFGEYQYAIPLYLAFSFGGALFPDHPALATAGEFGDRSLRALFVGAPMVGILQVGLGSASPAAQDSYWHPLRSNHGAAGDAFVGAIPFLTAASMTENRVLQTLLVAGSFGPAWSRIHTDDHYFSQVLLGWSIAYLSVHAVNQTEGQSPRFRIVPIEIPNGMGMGVQVQY
jgi:hypothetical protein